MDLKTGDDRGNVALNKHSVATTSSVLRFDANPSRNMLLKFHFVSTRKTQYCFALLYVLNYIISHYIPKLSNFEYYLDGLVQDCSISIANALEILQACTKPSKCSCLQIFYGYYYMFDPSVVRSSMPKCMKVPNKGASHAITPGH